MLSMNQLPFQLKPKSLMAVGCLTLALGGLISCENAAVQGRNEAAELTREASARLKQIAESAVYPMSAIRRDEIRSAYTSYVGKFASVPTGALQEQKADLSALGAEAYLALTKLALDEAGEMEEAVNAQLSLIIKDLGSAMELNIMAEVASDVDYSALKATIDQQGQLSRARQNDLKVQAQQVRKQITDLQSEIKSELARFDKISNDGATRREQAFSAPLDDQRAILEEAAALSRQADTHQVRAALLEARLDLLAPALQTVQMQIAQTETELISFDTSREALTRREEVAAQNVEARRVNLQEMASRIANDLDKIYAAKDQVTSKYDEAIASADNALVKANSARRSPGGETRIIQAQQGIGSAHWRRAQFLERVADIAQQMADEKKVLGRGDKDRVAYDSIQPDLTESNRKAGAAFTEAAQAANNLSDRDVDKETRQRLLNSLNASVKTITGSEAVEDSAEFDAVDAGEEFVDNNFDNTGASEGDPRETLRQLAAIDSIDNAEVIFDLVHPAGEMERELLDVVHTTFDGFVKLEQACKAEFGSGLTDQMADTSAETPPGFGVNPADFKAQFEDLRDKVETFEFRFDSAGTTAWVTNDPDLADYILVYVDGVWKIEFDLKSGDAAMAQAQPMIESLPKLADPIMTILSDTTDRVAAGDFPNLDAVGEYLGNAIMMEFMKLMGANNPGGFGGGGG